MSIVRIAVLVTPAGRDQWEGNVVHAARGCEAFLAATSTQDLIFKVEREILDMTGHGDTVEVWTAQTTSEIADRLTRHTPRDELFARLAAGDAGAVERRHIQIQKARRGR